MKWMKLGQIFDPTDHSLPNNCFEFAQSPQTLIFDDYIRVYFSTREKDNNGKYLSHVAFVDFDKTFHKILRISEQGWDDQSLAYPHVFEVDGKIYMLYLGNEVGRYGFGLARLISYTG